MDSLDIGMVGIVFVVMIIIIIGITGGWLMHFHLHDIERLSKITDADIDAIKRLEK